MTLEDIAVAKMSSKYEVNLKLDRTTGLGLVQRKRWNFMKPKTTGGGEDSPYRLAKPHIGKSSYRLNPSHGNPREVAFAKQWSKEQAEGQILANLIGTDYTDRDAMVAATVIQWLGSNVGMSFLEEAIALEPRIQQWLRRRAVV